MKTIPTDLAARLASGVTTLAHVWRTTRTDGAVFGFTDHDRVLVFEGLTCEPASALSLGAVEKSLGLGVDTASITGALESDAITEADLARGLWDGARVEFYRVDWREPTLFVHLFAGRIGEARRGAQAFEVELRGLQAPLNVPVGRVLSRYCDADLGDARCGVEADAPAFSGEGSVTEIVGATAFRASGLGAFAEGWFTRGVLTWTEGGRSDVAQHRVDGDDALIEVIDSPGVAPGATFTIVAGCDKRFATCRAKFANTINFRGFPHMPGSDALLAGPVSGDTLDGGSRFA